MHVIHGPHRALVERNHEIALTQAGDGGGTLGLHGYPSGAKITPDPTPAALWARRVPAPILTTAGPTCSTTETTARE